MGLGKEGDEEEQVLAARASPAAQLRLSLFLKVLCKRKGPKRQNNLLEEQPPVPGYYFGAPLSGRPRHARGWACHTLGYWEVSSQVEPDPVLTVSKSSCVPQATRVQWTSVLACWLKQQMA